MGTAVSVAAPPFAAPQAGRVATLAGTDTQQLLLRSPDQCALSNQLRTEPGQKRGRSLSVPSGIQFTAQAP